MSAVCAEDHKGESTPITPRYDIRPDVDGWTIIYAETDEPLMLNGHPMAGLSIGSAQDFANLLNRKDTRNRLKFGNVTVWQSPAA